ncbi:hypothetical protein OSB04_031963 [Centaurea solstitialis]|uniref:Uncharacterized protein n=1 Tax=Centaurea solstitialis TaxID=347529 RepID=A0AA38SN48_9ASTR|nr:hypothetical protein OSB04_031963 [Centaurea solstitialis]
MVTRKIVIDFRGCNNEDLRGEKSTGSPEKKSTAGRRRRTQLVGEEGDSFAGEEELRGIEQSFSLLQLGFVKGRGECSAQHGPHVPTSIIPFVAATDNTPAVQERSFVKLVANWSGEY